MESYTPKNFDDDKNPDKTGESKASKKKKKKSGILPLPVEKETAKPQDEITKSDKKSEAVDTDTPDLEQEIESSEELQLPDVEQSAEESEFMGELIIDHTPEDTETIDVPENILEFEEAVADAATELPAEQVDEPALEAATPELDSVYQDEYPETKPFESVVAETVSDSQPADTLPGGASFGELFNPSRREVNRVDEDTRYQTANMIPEPEAHRRAYKAEKRGLSRGVTSGVLAGWWLGRRSGRRQVERQQRAADYDRDKVVDRVQSQYTQLEQTTKRRESTLQRTIDRLRASIDSRKRSEDVYPSSIGESLPPQSPEKSMAITPQEKTYTDFPKPPVEETPAAEDGLQAPEGHRFESSAWHRIEVDNKTGHLVEQPSVSYGEAFQQEQQQERLAREAAKSQTAAQVARALSTSNQVITGGVLPEPPAEFWQQREQQQAKVSPPVDTAYIRQQFVHQTKSPVTWAIALTILALLLISGVL